MNQPNSEKNPAFLLEEAWKDSLTIESEEILPLITITKDNPNVLWDNTGEYVLMLSFHRHPEYYSNSNVIQLNIGEIWVTSFLEMKHWYDHNYSKNNQIHNWIKRFEMLLGIDLTGKETHFTAFWLNPNDLIRPAYNPNVTSPDVWDHFPEDFHDETYKKWFERHAQESYSNKKLPWTRLGYTYDWEDNGTEYGLCEFLVKKGAYAKIAFTKTVDEFVGYLDKYTT